MSVKTILVAHRVRSVRDRFAAALADARQDYVLAGTEAALRAAAENDRAPVSLALVDLGLARDDSRVTLVTSLRRSGPRSVPVVVFAGSVSSPDEIVRLGLAGVEGYVNEFADAPQILPSLAPHLFPDSFNRRADARVPVTVPVSFRAGQTIAAAQSRDISAGGVALQTMDPLPTGTPLQLTVRLPGTASDISSFGRVVWSDRRVGMGVQFERLTAEAQQLLDLLVNGKL